MRKYVFVAVAMMLVASIGCAQDLGAGTQELGAGATAPDFKLTNAVDGKEVAFKANDNQLKVVVFTCNQCPYAKAFEPRIVEIAERFGPKGVHFYAVDSNDEGTRIAA